MENIVIELSRYTSTDSPNNAVFTTNLKKPVIIEQGDEILIKQAFLDTRQIDQNSIEVQQDIQWTLQFGYYMINHGINLDTYTISEEGGQTEVNFSAANPDGLPYLLNVLFDPTKPETPIWETPQPLMDSFTINIPQGIYEKSYLAQYITRQLQQVGRPQNQQIKNNYFTNGQLYPEIINRQFTGKLINYNPPDNKNSIVTTFQKPLYLAVIQNTYLSLNPVLLLSLDGTGNFRPCGYVPLVNDNNIPETYNYVENPLFSNIISYISITTALGTVTINDNVYNIYDAGMIGASEMSFTFNDEGSNKYAFQYMHSPLINKGNECVGTYITEGNTSFERNISYLSSFSGIIMVDTFTNLTVKNNNKFVSDAFFDLLGLEYNDIVAPDISNIFNSVNPSQSTEIDYMNFRNVTTRNFFPQSALSDTINDTTTIGNFQLANYKSIYSKTGYSFIDSSATDEIVFSDEPTQSTTNGGHYLIDIKGYENEYIGGDKDYQIKAIIPNYFLSGDSFCQSIAPDSYSYQHTGVPMNLCKITTKILNPITKQPEVNLKGNSTIYLMVIKQIKQDIKK
jgi:hypothetical protein